MIAELIRDFDGSWQTIAVLMVIAAIVLKILGWLLFILAHYFAPEGNIPRLSGWLAWSAYALMFIAVVIFIVQ